MKPVKTQYFEYEEQHLFILGEASVHLKVGSNDFIIRALVCKHLKFDGVLINDFRTEYESQVLNAEHEDDDDDDIKQKALLNQLIGQNKLQRKLLSYLQARQSDIESIQVMPDQ